jgi:hypothetical protein
MPAGRGAAQTHGGRAGGIASKEVKAHALKNSFFVMEPFGATMKIDTPEGADRAEILFCPVRA